MFNEFFFDNALKKRLHCEKYVIGNYDKFEVSGIFTDSRNIIENGCFVAIKGKKFDGHDFIQELNNKGIKVFIASTEFKKEIKSKVKDGVVYFVDDTVRALGNLASYLKSELFCNTIAITGSSGKTTTRNLIASIMSKKYNVISPEKNYNNEIGLPLTMLQAKHGVHFMVLELGMNHLGEIRRLAKICKPFASIITNIGTAHIGELKGRDNIAKAKSEIIYETHKNGVVFLNKDDDYYDFLKSLTKQDVIDFSYNDIKIIEDYGFFGYKLSYKDNEFSYSLPGLHNLSNLACAIKVGEYFGVSLEDIIDSIANYKTIEGRNFIRKGRFILVDDSYNSNPDSLLAGLKILKETVGRKIAVIGDMLELGSYSHDLHKKIGMYIAEHTPANILFTIGNESKIIHKVAGTNTNILTKHFDNKQELINELINTIKDNDTVYLKASHSIGLQEVANELSKIL